MKPRPDRRSQRGTWVFLLFASLVWGGILARWLIFGASARPVEPGSELMVDDFGFQVRSTRWLPSIVDGDSLVRPSGRFLVGRLRVSNRARRVDFRFSPDQMFLEDADQEQYSYSQQGQRALNPLPSDPVIIAAGSSFESDIVFDVRSTARELRLRVRFGGRVGEILDWLIRGPRWFPLPMPDATSQTQRSIQPSSNRPASTKADSG